MAFFDDFGKKISNLGQTAVQKTKDATDIARLNSAINDEERNLNNIYRELGKAYYKLHSADPEPPFADYVRAVSEAEMRVAAYQKQIQDTRGSIRCPACGNQVANNSAFCNACGCKLQTAPPPQMNGTPCPSCGNPLSPSARFCNICGFKVEAPAPAPAPAVPPAPPSNPETIICPSCGESVNGSLKFCTMCGTKFDKPEAPLPPSPFATPTPPAPEDKSPFAKPDTPPAPPMPNNEETVICSSCGSTVKAGLNFCTSCGAKMSLEPPKPVGEITPSDIIREKADKDFDNKSADNKPDTVKCTNCGSDVKSDMAFCTICGTKLGNDVPPKTNDKPLEKPDIPKPPKPDEIPFGAPKPEPPKPPKPDEKPPKKPLDLGKKPPEKPPVGEPKCPGCGAIVTPGLNFCVTCGAKLPPPIEDKPPKPGDILFGKPDIPKPPKPDDKPFGKPDIPNPPKPDDKPFGKSEPPKPSKPDEDKFKTSFAAQEPPVSGKTPDIGKPPVEELKCPGCGAAIAPDTKFCVVCGVKLTPPPKSGKPPMPPKPEDKPLEIPVEPPKPEFKCTNCGTPMQPGLKFCTACGAKLGNEDSLLPETKNNKENKCPNCGTKAEPGLKFCTACGAKLNDFLSIAKSGSKKPRPKPPEELYTIAKSGSKKTDEKEDKKDDKPKAPEKKCKKCGAMMMAHLLYCTSCGSMLDEESSGGNNSGEIVCSSCGSLMSSDLKFCTACGSKLVNNQNNPPVNNIPVGNVPANNASANNIPVNNAPVNNPRPSNAGVKRCHNCNCLVDESVRFCTECGAPMDSGAPSPAPVGGNVPFGKKKCANCGAILDSSMRFCTSCGSSLGDSAAAPKAPMDYSKTVYAGSSGSAYEDYNQPTTVLSGNQFGDDDYNQPTTVLSGSPFDDEEDASPTINLDGQMCPNCRSMMASDMLFCTECGTRL